MSLSAIWERFWWSLLLTITLGLLWLKFIDPYVNCVSVGLIVCIGAGLIHFSLGIRKLVVQRNKEKEIEKQAYEELLEELQMENSK